MPNANRTPANDINGAIERNARAAKVERIRILVDLLVIKAGFDPTAQAEHVARFLEALPDAFWEALDNESARQMGVQKKTSSVPSTETKALVLSAYHERARISRSTRITLADMPAVRGTK